MYIRHVAYNINISPLEQLKPFDASNEQFFKDFRPFRRSSQKKGEKKASVTLSFVCSFHPTVYFLVLACNKIDSPLDSLERLVEFPHPKKSTKWRKAWLKALWWGGKIFGILEFCQGWGRGIKYFLHLWRCWMPVKSITETRRWVVYWTWKCEFSLPLLERADWEWSPAAAAEDMESSTRSVPDLYPRSYHHLSVGHFSTVIPSLEGETVGFRDGIKFCIIMSQLKALMTVSASLWIGKCITYKYLKKI